jgi:ribosomal protein S27AE
VTFLADPVVCVACGQPHILSEHDADQATRIGVSLVARECQWVMRYPGLEAHEVIEQLEKRLGSSSGPPREAVNGAPSPQEAVGDPPDDPALRASESDPSLTAGTRIACPVCGGDGEIGPEDDRQLCGRCSGECTVVVGV